MSWGDCYTVRSIHDNSLSEVNIEEEIYEFYFRYILHYVSVAGCDFYVEFVHLWAN